MVPDGGPHKVPLVHPMFVCATVISGHTCLSLLGPIPTAGMV